VIRLFQTSSIVLLAIVATFLQHFAVLSGRSGHIYLLFDLVGWSIVAYILTGFLLFALLTKSSLDYKTICGACGTEARSIYWYSIGPISMPMYYLQFMLLLTYVPLGLLVWLWARTRLKCQFCGTVSWFGS